MKAPHSRKRPVPRRQEVDLQPPDSLSSPLQRASRARPPLSARYAAVRRSLGRRTARRYHPGIRICSADGVPRPRERGQCAERRPTMFCGNKCPTGGWSNYPGGPADLSVSVKAYFALKLDRPRCRRALHAPRRQVILCARRRRRLQQLHQVLPRAARSVSLCELRLGAAGDGVAAALAVRQSLRHVELDAHHRRAAQHLLGVQTCASACRYKRDRRTLPSTAARRRSGRPEPSGRLLSWANFFLGSDLLVQESRSRGWVRFAVWPSSAPPTWMREHLHESDGLGAIFPPMIYTVICASLPRRPRRRSGDEMGFAAA